MKYSDFKKSEDTVRIDYLFLIKENDRMSVESTSEEYFDDEEEEVKELDSGGSNLQNKRMEQNMRPNWSTPDKTSGESRSISRTPGGTDSETGTGTGSESATDYETDDENNKTTIIKKDSEIIALKNELGVSIFFVFFLSLILL